MFITAKNKQDKYYITEFLEIDKENFAEYKGKALKKLETTSEIIQPNSNQGLLLLTVGEGSAEGVLSDFSTSGADKAPVIILDARSQVKDQIIKLANYCINQGLEHSEDGSWSVTYDELFHHFDGTNISQNNLIGKMLAKKLGQKDEINTVTLTEDTIDMAYDVKYCFREKNTAEKTPLKLKDLMRCELSSIHLCHADEDHDLATIEDLNSNTLTEAGKSAWSDVLNAEVKSIYSGYYGIQIGVDGCDVERVKDFSYVLAGHCSSDDYDKWVKGTEKTQQPEPQNSSQNM